MENEKTAPLEQGAEDEIAMNKATYLTWKEDLKRNGKTPSDAVAWCRARGFAEYADRLDRFIDQMEGSEQTAEPQEGIHSCSQNSRKVFDQQCEDSTCKNTQKRIKKLESSIRLLTSFLIGHLVGELLSKIFFR